MNTLNGTLESMTKRFIETEEKFVKSYTENKSIVNDIVALIKFDGDLNLKQREALEAQYFNLEYSAYCHFLTKNLDSLKVKYNDLFTFYQPLDIRIIYLTYIEFIKNIEKYVKFDDNSFTFSYQIQFIRFYRNNAIVYTDFEKKFVRMTKIDEDSRKLSVTAPDGVKEAIVIGKINDISIPALFTTKLDDDYKIDEIILTTSFFDDEDIRNFRLEPEKFEDIKNKKDEKK